MGEDQLESQLAGLFSDFVAPEPDPPPGPLTGPHRPGTPAALAAAEAKRATEPRVRAAGLGAKGRSRRVVILHSPWRRLAPSWSVMGRACC
jgi:hypothetical protein